LIGGAVFAAAVAFPAVGFFGGIRRKETWRFWSVYKLSFGPCLVFATSRLNPLFMQGLQPDCILTACCSPCPC
jgi:hypothetical protein